MTMVAANRAGFLLVPHLVAIAFSMFYAWHISRSAYVTSGLQFLSPLLIILLCHLAILRLRGRLVSGYAGQVLARTALSSVLIVCLVFVADLSSPAPSHADVTAGGALGSILSILFCVLVLGVVLAIAGGALYLLYLLFAALIRWTIGGSKDDRLHDLASIVVAIALITGASLEGVAGAYKLRGNDYSVASYRVDAPPEVVWDAMQTATSPEFPLPDLLSMFPRPVAVLVDEGTELGANRVVQFTGREGQGRLHLRVAEQVGHHAVFEVVSDTSPLSRWVKFEALSYTVTENAFGARLDVRLDYERLLAPSWIFTPMVESIAYLAVSVLAHDTKIRAELGAASMRGGQ